MTGSAGQARETAEPRLTRGQINTIIRCLIRARDDERATEVAGILIAFYTRRWGLPPSVRAELTSSPES